MNKNKFSRYNDGVVSIYREKPRPTSFGAKKNVSDIGDLEFIVKLDYEEAARREQDLEFAEQVGFSLSLKVKTRLFRAVDNQCKAIIDGYLYAVKEVDKDRENMWLFLEGERSIKNAT